MPTTRHFGSQRDDRERRDERSGDTRSDSRSAPTPTARTSGLDRPSASEEPDYPYSYDIDEEEPLSIAEEIAAGAEDLPADIQERYEQAKPTTDTHIVRTAEDVDGRVDRRGPQGERHRIRRQSRSRS